MATITFRVWDGGILADAVSCVLSDRTGSYGIKRTSTGAVIVPAGTVLVKTFTGIYSYVFTPPARLVQYTIWVKVVTRAGTDYYELLYTPPAEDITIVTPADILHRHLIQVSRLFADPPSEDDWPLYNGRLPDTPHVDDDIAAIFDTPGIVRPKNMHGESQTSHGIQLRTRSVEEGDGYSKLKAVLNALLPISRETIVLGTEMWMIQNVNQASDIVRIAVDDKKRYHLTLSLLMKIKQV